MGKEGEGSGCKNAVSLPLFQLIYDIQHRLTGGEDIIRNKDILSFHRIAQVFMGYNGIPPVDDPGVIPSLVEHPQVHAQHRGIVHVPVHCPFIRADDHKVILVEL